MNLVSDIKNNKNVRESLIELKAMVQKGMSIQKDEELRILLIHLLDNEDPKIRKNSAVLLGRFTNTADILLAGYKKEKTDYVKEAYLKGMSFQNCQNYIGDLIQIQQQLMNYEDTSFKHIQAQLKILNPLILKNSVHKKKIIKLKHQPVDVILTSLPYYQFVLFESVLGLRYKPVSQGVLVRTESLYDLLTIRCYKDLLIPLQRAANMDINIETIVEGLRKCNLLDILNKLYDDNNSVFYFKAVDGMRRKDPQLIKKVSEALFEMYPTKLLNTTQNYDIEIVLKEVRRDKVNVYLRLTHLNNPRFSYRKEITATSMQPYVAATLVEIAKPYMKDDAKVLDPFVGTGTLLIEKNIAKPSHFSMGIDVYGKGIEAARKNTKLANQVIYYVHKDSLRFVNSEMFDEIITDMPTESQVKEPEQLHELYERFFNRIKKLVKPDGYIFLYTSEISLVRSNLKLQEGYLTLEEHYDIPRGKNMFYFFIIKVK